ncbi:ATP-binding protein [Bifidobacterium samirii]|nr:ATP-binding protein [Bifidobacterium samirii]
MTSPERTRTASEAAYVPSAPSAPSAPPPPRPPLLRPRHGRLLCGVCRGVAIHLSMPVWLIRLIFTVVACCGGAGVVAYVFLWLFVPSGDPMLLTDMRFAAIPAARAPLSRGNRPVDDEAMRPDEPLESSAQEDLLDAIRHAPKPALVAVGGIALLALAGLLLYRRVDVMLLVPVTLALAGVGVAWLRRDAKDGQLWTMIGGIALLFAAYALFVAHTARPGRFADLLQPIVAGALLLAGCALAIVPWITALIRSLGAERASKEREEERADMTAHLHDGVLQTLALIQLHSTESATVFALARQQERELREWLYQERTTSDRSVSAGIKEVAGEVEDAHGRPIDVVTVGDAQPSAQTDALLDAARQALVNAVTHGGEPVSVYCEAGPDLIELFVRDHGDGFDPESIPEGRLGIRESIVGRVRRRGGTVDIVSRPGWGTEVRMRMPISAATTTGRGADERNA